MRLSRLVGLAVLVSIGLVALGAQVAGAQAPEYGRCAKKVKAGGAGYGNAGCTSAVSSEAKYEWMPGPGSKPDFTVVERFVFGPKHNDCEIAVSEYALAEEDRARAATASEPEKAELLLQAEQHEATAKQRLSMAGLTRSECEKLLTTEQAKAPVTLRPVKTSSAKVIVIECGGLHGSGDYASEKTVAGVAMTFTECTRGGVACESPTAGEGEVLTTTLEGEVGVISAAALGVPEKVGVDLHPASGSVFAEFSCGTTSVLVSGSAIRQAAGNHMMGLENERFTQTGGHQRPESFEGLPPDVLSSSFSGAPEVQTGLTLRGLVTNEERIELNMVV